MEKRKILIEQDENTVFIGEMPRLVVDLENQNNYIETDGRRIPYYREIRLSRDLLEGKRANVFDTAVSYYYEQACSVVRGIQDAQAYRLKANKTVREFK